MIEGNELNYKSILVELENLIEGKIDSKSTQRIKECANSIILQNRESELLNLLDQKFSPERITKYKHHLLSVVSSIYSGISLKRGLDFCLLVIKKVKPAPNMVVGDLLRNSRKLHNYDVVDEIIIKNSELLNNNEINILYELIFYFDFKGDNLRLQKILAMIEKAYSTNKPIMQNLLNLYIKYGTVEDVNRINSILNPNNAFEQIITEKKSSTYSKSIKDKLLLGQDSSHRKIVIKRRINTENPSFTKSNPNLFFDNKKETEYELQESLINDLLEKMKSYEQKAKQAILSEMVNGISHEFGQPITNIKFLIQYNQKMLNDTVSKEEVLKIFSSILEDIERLSHLVKTIAPITSSKSTIEYFNIVDRIKKMFELSSPRLLENKITYKIISPEPNLQLFQDSIKFEQIINNLLFNAIDSLSEKNIPSKWIQVEIKSKNGKIYIDFKDNGVGIPDSKRKNIFIPFYTTKAEGKGEGLGLYIVWNLLKMMDGVINLDYSYNTGACFKIEIPIKQDGEKQ